MAAWLPWRKERALPSPEAVAALSLTQTWGSGSALDIGSPTATERVLSTFTSFSIEGYASNSTVYACELARLQLLSQAEFKFQRLDTRRLFGTPELQILEEPWPGGTTADLIARMEQHGALAGNAFVRRAGNSLVLMRPDWTDIVSVIVYDGEDHDGKPQTHREVVGYVYTEGGANPDGATFYPVEEVVHWAPIPDPMATWRGMSWLTPVLREINADVAMTKHRQTFFDNAATPNIMLKYQQKLTPDQLDKIKRQWQARHGGPTKAGGTVVLDEGADFTVVGQSFEQMRFNDIQAHGEARIAAAAGVPAIIAGLQAGLDAATYSNYAMAMKAMANGTGAYLWRSLCSSLQKLVNVPAGSRLWWDTTNIPALREDEKDRAAAMQMLAATASTLLSAGYEAESITAALLSNDLSQLKHSGMVSVQLYKPGAVPTVLPSPDLPVRSEHLPDDRPVEVHVHPTIDVSVPAAQVEVRNEAPAAPVVNVHVEPTPVTVQNTVEPAAAAVQVHVEPTPVTVRNEVKPTDVTVVPMPPVTRKVKRDRDGNIIAVVEE